MEDYIKEMKKIGGKNKSMGTEKRYSDCDKSHDSVIDYVDFDANTITNIHTKQFNDLKNSIKNVTNKTTEKSNLKTLPKTTAVISSHSVFDNSSQPWGAN